MARPQKCRRVAYMPGVTFFKPAAVPMKALEEIRITVEEAEALRLRDLEAFQQEEAAEKMNVSRPTFQRILASARQKIADALLNGKAMKIEGGNFEIRRRFRCEYGHEWAADITLNESPGLCPTCNTSNIRPMAGGGYGRRKRGARRG